MDMLYIISNGYVIYTYVWCVWEIKNKMIISIFDICLKQKLYYIILFSI